MNNKVLTSKICEACGQTFSCGALAGSCWCMKVPLEAPALKTLRKNYEDCLCETCLKKMSERQAEPGSGKDPVRVAD